VTTNEPIDQIVRELDGMLAVAAGTHAFSKAGIRQVLEFFSHAPRTSENPDPTVGLGLGDPNVDSQRYARFKPSELPMLLAPEGPVVTQLGQQWAVFVFAEWEHSFRPRLAAARGLQPNEVEVVVFGDLRRIRHDILHNGAIATKEWSWRCQSLKWFQPGDPIVVAATHIADFVAKVPWDDLRQAA